MFAYAMCKTTLATEDQVRLRKFVNTVGEAAACVEVGVHRATLARLLAGLGVKGAVARLARLTLDRVAPDEDDDGR